ncbi:MAG: LysR family transcriptional regulator [Alphaproteobacteria bacterium]|nr:LysR family transcriptional regulator [Alphaproteobacteria bacterium]
MDTLTSMGLFVRAVDTGSFSAAARQMSLTPSAVSKQISRLEDRLGVRLFNRTTRRLAQTEEGVAYYERCRRILADVDEAEQAISQLNQTPRGVLKINMPVVFGRRHVVPVLCGFLAAWPEVQLHVTMTDQFVDPIEEGVDMLIRIGELKDSSLIARKLATARRAIAATPRYWDKHGRPQVPEDLAGHNCLTYAYLSSGDAWRMIGPDGSEHAVTVRGNLSANNAEALHDLALGDVGVMMAPTWMCGEALREGRLEEVLTNYAPTSPPVWAIYPPGRHLSPKVRAFVDHLAEEFRKRPWDDGAA